jgi:hypothetical protein
LSSAARAASPARLILCGIVTLAGASLARPASAVELYFNSYGWDKIYHLDSSSADGVAKLLPSVNLVDTTFLHATDRGPDGRIYGAIGDDLWNIDVSGTKADWHKVLVLDKRGGELLAWSPAGALYAGESSSKLRQVNPLTGATVAGTEVNVTFAGNELFLWGIDFSPSGVLYGVDSTDIFTIDLANGIATRIADLDYSGTHGIFTELDYASDGKLRALGWHGYLYVYDPVAGAGNWSIPLTYEGSYFSASSLASVPEPTTLSLTAVGALTLLAVVARRRRRR